MVSAVAPVVTCGYCSLPADLVTGAVIYPYRVELSDRLFYRCKPCEAHVGCHPGTTRPLGGLANKQLRLARVQAHAAFDPLWKKGSWPRPKAYRWLADRLGIAPDACHIAHFDLNQCRRTVDVVRTLSALVEGVRR